MNKSTPNPANVRDAMHRIHKTNNAIRSIHDDPYPCPCLGDFIEDYNRRVRRLAAYIVNHSPKNSHRYTFAMNILEGYLP